MPDCNEEGCWGCRRCALQCLVGVNGCQGPLLTKAMLLRCLILSTSVVGAPWKGWTTGETSRC